MAEDESKQSELRMLFGKRMAVIRKLRGVSQERFASESGLARSHVSGIERGKINVSLATICVIAQALHVEPKELLDFYSTTVCELSNDGSSVGGDALNGSSKKN
jgi:transcriptional regulator with XRE-family HTH domain